MCFLICSSLAVFSFSIFFSFRTQRYKVASSRSVINVHNWTFHPTCLTHYYLICSLKSKILLLANGLRGGERPCGTLTVLKEASVVLGFELKCFRHPSKSQDSY